MISFLKVLFLVVLSSMLWVTTWASSQCPLFAVPRGVATHPWFIATLFDAYWGFTTFYVWVAYKETAWSARIAWLVAIMALGNIAMASYCLAELFQQPPDGTFSSILTVRRKGTGALGIALALTGTAIAVTAFLGSHPL